MANKVWFITGTSSGFGWEWARAALARGDRVAGTARTPSMIDPIVAEYPDSFWAAPRAETLARAQAAFEHCWTNPQWSSPPSAAARRLTVKESR